MDSGIRSRGFSPFTEKNEKKLPLAQSLLSSPQMSHCVLETCVKKNNKKKQKNKKITDWFNSMANIKF